MGKAGSKADSGTSTARVLELSLEIASSNVTSLPTPSCSRSPLSIQSLKRQNCVIATQTQEPRHSAKYIAFLSFNHRDSSVRLYW